MTTMLGRSAACAAGWNGINPNSSAIALVQLVRIVGRLFAGGNALGATPSITERTNARCGRPSDLLSCPRSAWECRLRRSAAPGVTKDSGPSSDAPAPDHPTRPQSDQDGGIPTEDRGNENAARAPVSRGGARRGSLDEALRIRCDLDRIAEAHDEQADPLFAAGCDDGTL